VNKKQALSIAIKVLQERQRQYKGFAVYYRDFGGPYKAEYDKWQALNEAIEVLQSLKAIEA